MPDKIQALIDAARAEERASLKVESVLREIHERLTDLEREYKELNSRISWVKEIAQQTYTNVNILIQLMAAMWKGDRKSLTEVQQKIAEQAFAETQKEEAATAAAMNIKVDAGGGVQISSDKVGRDKKEVKNDEKTKC